MDVLGVQCKWTPKCPVLTKLKDVLMMLIDEWPMHMTTNIAIIFTNGSNQCPASFCAVVFYYLFFCFYFVAGNDKADIRTKHLLQFLHPALHLF